MARRKKGTKLNFPFTAVPKHITRSKAWFSCSPAARLIWIAVLERYNGENNGEISLSVREAGSYAGCTKNTAGKKFIELLDAGLLQCTMKTSFNNGKGLASTWALTHLPIGGKAATNLWKRMENKT